MKQRDAKTLQVLADLIGVRLQGDPNCLITGIATLENAKEGDISFLSNQQYRKYLTSTKASAIILSAEDAKKLLCEQLVSPVKYKHSILHVEETTDMFIEFGGNVLKGLNKRITSKPTHSITDMKSLEEVLLLMQ